MNIFYLDNSSSECAYAHCDKHVVKMILEYAQLLSTAHRVIDGEQYIGYTKANRKIKRWRLADKKEAILYKATHINHPSAIWVRESKENYNWLFSLFGELLKEYTYRYNKYHKCGELFSSLVAPPINLSSKGLTTMPQAMPDECKKDNSIDAYREYYSTIKRDMLTYSKRNAPNWL